ncbi:CRISPR-associated protein, VVA1548 family [Acidithiobacillus sp. GGI-221]|nr:CRISPR-associated protein, VVA1548 family [Acidithiobacillus sp. GGI-221]
MKKVFFVSRHPGAIEWAARHGIQGAELISHFEPDDIEPGDEVIGTLPINIVAEVNRLGGTYQHLSMDLPADARGKELTADDMEKYGARLETFYAASQDRAIANVNVGEWDDFNGEYGPECPYHIQSTMNIEGAILHLFGENIETRDVYIERIPGAWRINVSMDQQDISQQVSLRDDGQILYE